MRQYESIMEDPNATQAQKKAISISLNQVLINEFTHYGDALDGVDAILNANDEVVNHPDPAEGAEGGMLSEFDEGNEAVADLFMIYGTSLRDGLQNYMLLEKGVYLDPDTLREIDRDPSEIDPTLIPPLPELDK